MFSKNELVDIAIRIEKNGEHVYLRAIEKVNDTGLKDLLKWMAAEEHRHAEWFSKLKNEIRENGPEALFKEMSDALIRDAVDGQAFSLKEVDFSAISTSHELIDIFVEFENDTILFYEFMKTFISDEDALERLDEIIGEEKTHIRKIKEFREPADKPFS